LNQDQTQNILDTARIEERMKSFVPSLLNLSTPTASEPDASSTGNTEHNEYNIEVNINGNADRKVADTVADQIINKIKRTKGGRF
ncbi:hypothetical protein M5X02_32345, partial [Paenibacillus alvei]|nr:hypothetical protein [Paenibacillus alvei]